MVHRAVNGLELKGKYNLSQCSFYLRFTNCKKSYKMKSAILYSLCLISFISLNAQSGISYEMSAERLNYKKQQELYVFVIKNTGENRLSYFQCRSRCSCGFLVLYRGGYWTAGRTQNTSYRCKTTGKEEEAQTFSIESNRFVGRRRYW